MRLVVIDFETYFADDFTLSKMSTEAYCRDIRFEAHGAAIKWSPDHAARWYDERQLRYVLSQEDWSDVFLIAWHAQFDMLILSHHYGVIPRMYGCPMSMARLLHPAHVSVSLDNIRKLYGMPSKTTPYNAFKNLHWHQMSPEVQDQVARGAEDEVESIWTLFQRFLKDTPLEELEVIDETVRMFAQPVLRADTKLLAELWSSEEARRAQRAAALGISPTELQSNQRFQQLLEAEGVEIEYKAGKNGPIPQFAKTDDFMRDVLLEHENERVRDLAQARLGMKSTILQTRAETFGWMASRGALPVYLRYCGASTLRPTGSDNSNFLNMKRGSAIRRSLLAPEGYLLAPLDSAQIECRCLHYLAGGPDEPVVQKFRNGEDPYVDLASLFYREPIYKPEKNDPRRDEMEAKRGMGKQGRLMCLGARTAILTNNGIKPIVDVSVNDLLWDGLEWVKHRGLISQGEQNVVELEGVQVTFDHLILCGIYGWLPAVECLLDDNILCHALANGLRNLPSPAMNWGRVEVLPTSWSAVLAAPLSMLRILQIFTKVKVRVAAHVLQNKLVSGLKNITGTLTFAQIKNTVRDCWGAFLSSTIVLAPIAKTSGMAVAGLRFTNRGAVKADVENFCDIFSRLKVGTIHNFKSIVSTTTAVTNRAIFALLHARSNKTTSARCVNLKMKLPTYDLAFAGPRNRFTIVSDAGPLIVHNCGYGAAGKQFKITAKNGLYGPPVDISLEDANAFVALYRQENPSICAKNSGYWAQAERMIARLAGGPPIEWGPFMVRDHRIYLPDGQMLHYDTLEFHRPDSDEEVRDFERAGYWRVRTRTGFKKMWGSKLVQNLCEAVSRVIVTQAMVRIKRLGFRTLNHPYDELLVLIPRDGNEEKHLAACKAEMLKAPSWLPDFPLAVDGELSDRYSK